MKKLDVSDIAFDRLDRLASDLGVDTNSLADALFRWIHPRLVSEYADKHEKQLGAMKKR